MSKYNRMSQTGGRRTPTALVDEGAAAFAKDNSVRLTMRKAFNFSAGDVPLRGERILSVRSSRRGGAGNFPGRRRRKMTSSDGASASGLFLKRIFLGRRAFRSFIRVDADPIECHP